MPDRDSVELSVVVPVPGRAGARESSVSALRAALDRIGVSYEVSVVSDPGGSYRDALLNGFAQARGRYILTVDPDAELPSAFVETLWRERALADVTIASRYVTGGQADMPAARRAMSRLMNGAFRAGLNVPIRDLSSGFRLYNADVLRHQSYASRGYEILQEIIVKAYAEGWKVREVPFTYKPEAEGGAGRRGLRVARDCAVTFWDLWRLRNSILAADYDDRAHDSRIPLQRYWQRSRYRHITDLIAGEGAVLDVGCGSSQIIGALPRGSVGVDVLQRKLRYARKFGRPLARASGFQLPFRDASFPCVLCSQVIEHVPKESPILSELVRVLAPGGRLVLGTPDYDRWEWVVTEKAYGMAAPGGYADEHIAHYSQAELTRHFEQLGFRVEAVRYILRGELIMAFRRSDGPSPSH
jgi:ubiquinone/menaquinone biosynthesis C-methylase UbiE